LTHLCSGHLQWRLFPQHEGETSLNECISIVLVSTIDLVN